MEQDQLTISEHANPQLFGGARVAQSLVFYVLCTIVYLLSFFVVSLAIALTVFN